MSVCLSVRLSQVIVLLKRINVGSCNGGAKCRRGRLNAGVVAENGQLSTRSIVNLFWSHVYHTEHPPYLFAARLPLRSTSSLSSAADSCCKCKLNDSPKLCQEVAGIIIFCDVGFVISL